MTLDIAEDVLELLRRDRSERAAHYACLKAIPFCKESETLEHGVKRLGAWLTVSVKLNHRPLNKVVVIVLTCFLLKDARRVTCVADLNDAWLDIARLVVSPCSTNVDEKYLRDARMTALFTLYKYLPGTYRVELMSVKPADATSTTRHILEEFQRVARRDVVGKLVDFAIRNVLKEVRETARSERLRLKKERRRLAKSIDPLPLDDVCPGGANEGCPTTEDAPPHTSLLVTTASAADECAVCLDPIGSKRPLFTCGHARCCAVCAPAMQECPLCRQEVTVLMQIFV